MAERDVSKPLNRGRDVLDFLGGKGLALAVACMSSSMRFEGSCRDEISRLIPAIFSHHSAEYLPPIFASRRRVNDPHHSHNGGKIMYVLREIPGGELLELGL